MSIDFAARREREDREPSDPNTLRAMDAENDPTIDLPSPGDQPSAPSVHPSPQRFGGFAVRRRIGRGGMGVVYEAEQRHPQRLVALKLIRAGHASPELLRRFEYESQVLARLQHVGIAQVFQSGTLKDDAGRSLPYFAMELIEGKQLIAHACEGGLSLDERLEILARICDAVSHAHQKGVIHRDLKPANILVDRSGQPKVLDFGVARLVADDVQQATMRTDVGQIVGTVQYMSPEQTSGDPAGIDTRSDIYSLGVIAYELLADKVPYDVRKGTLADAVQTIREVDPPPVGSANVEARGDVEAIIAKAMEKDRTQRYHTADALAADIRRYLNDEPITARPASALYQLGKFARRHRGLTAGLLTAVAVLLVGIAGTSYGLLRAQGAEERLTEQLRQTEAAQAAEAHERLRADEARTLAEEARARAEGEQELAVAAKAESERRAAELEAVADFQASLLRRTRPRKAGALLSANVVAKVSAELDRRELDPTSRANAMEQFESLWTAINPTDLAREFLDTSILKPAVRAIDRRFADQPVLAARLQQVLADRYRDLGLIDAALSLQESALATRRTELGNAHPHTRMSMRGMADLLSAAGRADEAALLYREILTVRPPRRASALARLLEAEGQHVDAVAHLRELLERTRGSHGDDHVATLRLIDRLASALEATGDLVEAESLRREAVESARRLLRGTNPELAAIVGRLGALLLDLGRLAEAEPLVLEAMRTSRTAHGDAHPTSVHWTCEACSLRTAQGRSSDGLALLKEIAPSAKAALAGGQPASFAAFLVLLGNSRAANGDFEGAEADLMEALAALPSDATDDRAAAREATMEAIADMFVAWNAMQPNARAAHEATAWRARINVALEDDE